MKRKSFEFLNSGEHFALIFTLMGEEVFQAGINAAGHRTKEFSKRYPLWPFFPIKRWRAFQNERGTDMKKLEKFSNWGNQTSLIFTLKSEEVFQSGNNAARYQAKNFSKKVATFAVFLPYKVKGFLNGITDVGFRSEKISKITFHFPDFFPLRSEGRLP